VWRRVSQQEGLIVDVKDMAAGGSDGKTARRVALIAVVCTVVALLVVLLVSFFDLAHLDAESVADRVRASGVVGPLLLILLLVVQAVVAPLPSPPILMAAGFVYGPWLGFGIGWVGLLLGAIACFGLARALGRPFAERFVRPERLAAVDEYASTRTGATLLTLVSMRVFMPPAFDAVSYGCGLVRVPLPLFLLATALGEIPKVGSFTYIGAAAGGVPSWLTTWVLLAPTVGVIGLKLIRSRRARRDVRPVGGDRSGGSERRLRDGDQGVNPS
jgi:uncharacterized membrane protein YdjX (TVP38/TMEM64 family)